MTVRIAIRVDASPEMGLGHLVRCLSLAQALRRAGAQVCFATRDLGVDSVARLAAAHFEVRPLRAPSRPWTPAPDTPPHARWAGLSAEEDADQAVESLRPFAPDWLVVDHYAFDGRWHARTAAALDTRIAAIDDLADRALEVDLLVDHNFGAHESKYRGHLSAHARCLAGPRYALLGPGYGEAPRHRPSGRLGSIGIFLGGIDRDGMSLVAWKGCREGAGFEGPIEIVTTRANPRLDDLRAAVAADPSTTLRIDLPDLGAFFAAHDLQIGAGGGATWERCCVGAPTLLLLLAGNQQKVVPALTAAGVVAALGASETPGADTIGRAVAALMHEPQRLATLGAQARRLVDGRGAERVALAMLSATLAVRPVTAADGTTMHRWRNDPSTRAVSHDAAEVPLDVHLRWLDAALTEPMRVLLVGHVGDIEVGIVRFDLSDNDALVSIYLDPALHGLGLGAALLAAGEAAVAGRMPAGGTFVADVLEDNAASRRLFESAGYRFDALRGRKPMAASAAPSKELL